MGAPSRLRNENEKASGAAGATAEPVKSRPATPSGMAERNVFARRLKDVTRSPDPVDSAPPLPPPQPSTARPRTDHSFSSLTHFPLDVVTLCD